LQNVFLFLKLAWYAVWGWASVAYVERPEEPVENKTGGVNTLHDVYIKVVCIETTTKWYLLKRMRKCLERS